LSFHTVTVAQFVAQFFVLLARLQRWRDRLLNCGMIPILGIIDDIRKAAKQGFAGAQNNLHFTYYLIGEAYYRGEGVAKNAVEGYAWMNLAAVTDEDAKKKRAVLEKRLTAQQIADGQKRSAELSALIKENESKK
jgi:hypothetical protein